jgi:hypothetical protein
LASSPGNLESGPEGRDGRRLNTVIRDQGTPHADSAVTTEASFAAYF